jgi:hypothetical protein
VDETQVAHMRVQNDVKGDGDKSKLCKDYAILFSSLVFVGRTLKLSFLS